MLVTCTITVNCIFETEVSFQDIFMVAVDALEHCVSHNFQAGAIAYKEDGMNCSLMKHFGLAELVETLRYDKNP